MQAEHSPVFGGPQYFGSALRFLNGCGRLSLNAFAVAALAAFIGLVVVSCLLAINFMLPSSWRVVVIPEAEFKMWAAIAIGLISAASLGHCVKIVLRRNPNGFSLDFLDDEQHGGLLVIAVIVLSAMGWRTFSSPSVETYDECLLKYIPQAKTNYIAGEIRESCRRRYGG